MKKRRDTGAMRRRVTDSELTRLLEATLKAPPRCGLTGQMRAAAYWLTVEAGCSPEDLCSLECGDFNLDGHRPAISGVPFRPRYRVPPAQKAIVERMESELRDLLTGMAPEARPFNLPPKMAEMIRPDLADAGIPYGDDRGRFFDFRALRRLCNTWATVRRVPADEMHHGPRGAGRGNKVNRPRRPRGLAIEKQRREQ